MKKVIEIVEDEVGNKQALFICPGCGLGHAPYINGKGVPVWGFNNNLEKPTLTPSILVRWVSRPKNPEKDKNGKYMLDAEGRIKGAKNEVCHSFVTDGNIKFLGDCTHKEKNSTLPLTEL